jgi:hypothetical protein
MSSHLELQPRSQCLHRWYYGNHRDKRLSTVRFIGHVLGRQIVTPGLLSENPGTSSCVLHAPEPAHNVFVLDVLSSSTERTHYQQV